MFKRNKEPKPIKPPKPEPTYEEKMLDMMKQQLKCLQSLRENVRFFVFLAILMILLQVVNWFLSI